MLNSKRIVLTIFTSVASELVAKGFPLIVLFYVLRRIGVEEFGEAQFGISVMELALPFILFGYNLHGTILVGKNQNDAKKIGEAITDIVTCKLIHACIVFVIILISLSVSPSHKQYIPIVLAVSFYLFFTAIELSWVQLGIQKMSVFSIMQVTAKIPALIAILILVDDSSDGLLYAVLLLSANALCCLLTFIHVVRIYKPALPSSSRLLPMFKRSLGVSIGLVLAGTLDRIDIIMAEVLHGQKAIGLYAGQARLAHSINQIFLVVGSTFFSEIVSVENDDGFKKHLDVGLWTILCLYFPIAIGAFFLGPSFVQMFLGQEFVGFEAVFWILTIGLVSNVLVFVYGWQVLYVKGMTKEVALSMGLAASCVFGLTLLCGSIEGISGIAIGSSLGRAVGASLLIFFGAKFYLPAFQIIKSSLLPAIVMLIPLGLTPSWSFFPRFGLSVCVLVAAHFFINRDKIVAIYRRLKPKGA